MKKKKRKKSWGPHVIKNYKGKKDDFSKVCARGGGSCPLLVLSFVIYLIIESQKNLWLGVFMGGGKYIVGPAEAFQARVLPFSQPSWAFLSSLHTSYLFLFLFLTSTY